MNLKCSKNIINGFVLPEYFRVSLHRVIPCLAKEFVNAQMVPFVLPVVLQIAEEASSSDFVQYVLPDLRPVMKMTDPIQVTYIIKSLYFWCYVRSYKVILFKRSHLPELLFEFLINNSNMMANEIQILI